MKRNILLTSALLCILLMGLAGCTDKREELKKAVGIANSQCPMDFGSVGKCVEITYDDNTVIFNYEINETYTNVASLSKNEESLKEGMLMMFSNPKGPMSMLVDLIQECDAKIKFNLHGDTSGTTASVILNADELKKAADTKVTPLDMLKKAVETTNLQMPMEIAPGMTMKELEIVGDNVTYFCEIDESLHSIEMINENKSMAREQILYNIKYMGPVEKAFIDIVANAGKNLAYRYIGNQSGAYAEVVITNAELR